VHRIKELAPAPGAIPDQQSLGLGAPPSPDSNATTSQAARSVSSAPLRPSAPQADAALAKKSVETRPPTQPTVAPAPAQSSSSALSSRDEQLRLRLKKAMGSMGA